jgi:hypothetical protein
MQPTTNGRELKNGHAGPRAELGSRLNCLVSAHGTIETAAKKHNYGALSVRSLTQCESIRLDQCNLWIFNLIAIATAAGASSIKVSPS